MALYHDNDRLPGYLTNKEIAILTKYMVEASVKCKCGHTVLVPRRIDKKICTWCGNYVFRNKEDEFKYRLEEMRKNNE